MSGDAFDAHTPMVAWLAYLPARVAMLEQLRTSPSGWTSLATAERSLLTLPGAMEAADVLQELPAELSAGPSPVPRRGYLAVVGMCVGCLKKWYGGERAGWGVLRAEGEVAVAELGVYERQLLVDEDVELIYKTVRHIYVSDPCNLNHISQYIVNVDRSYSTPEATRYVAHLGHGGL